jgi:deoxyribonuclease-1
MRLILILSLFFSSTVFSQSLPLYYGSEFLNAYHDNSLRNEDLKSLLFTILSGGHIKKTHAPDEIVPSCHGVPDCVQHGALGYDLGRKKLFGLLFLKQKPDGTYFVKDVYCEREFTDDDFKDKPSIAPDTIPIGGSILNTEHTWPQSKFSTRFTKDMQKSDLHHLFPTDSEMNNHRAALRFGYVVNIKSEQKCKQNKLGNNSKGELVFEVPDSQKGNTARAIFYFSTRYQMKMSPAEETDLRQWHKQDPVDEEEFRQNNQIHELQGNRNPFIDFADLSDRINRF